MNAGNKFPVNWFDLLVVALLVVGVFRGRKRGMSLELLDLIQWLVIIFAGAFLYKPIGEMFAQMTSTGMLFSYLFVYVWIAVATKILFIIIKQTIGARLVGSDLFGGAEYYLAMVAGLLRFGCMVMMSLALLNARYFSPAEIAADEKMKKEVYGSDFFPGLSTLQNEVFENSLSGSFVKKQVEVMLIKPTPPRQGGYKLKEFNPS